LAFRYYEEERKRLVKDIKEVQEQLHRQKLSSAEGTRRATTQGFFHSGDSKELLRQKKLLNDKHNKRAEKMKQLKKLRSKMDKLKNERSVLGDDNNPLIQSIR